MAGAWGAGGAGATLLMPPLCVLQFGGAVYGGKSSQITISSSTLTGNNAEVVSTRLGTVGFHLHVEKGWGGPERPAVRAMLTLAHRLEKMDRFAELMASPEAVDDPMLAAVAQACASTPEETASWGKRLAELTML